MFIRDRNNRAQLNREFFADQHYGYYKSIMFEERLFCVKCGLMSTMLPLSGDPVDHDSGHVISCDYIKYLVDIMES